jgi:glycosyltransferase involved in cell wall biosynthesis
MKVGFYFDKNNAGNLNCLGIMKGNPGLGGSEYEFLLVSYLLEQRDIDPVLFTASPILVPHQHVITVKGIKELCDSCIKENISILVINQGAFDRSFFDFYGDKISLILWAHNDMSSDQLDVFNKLSYVKRIVCCGREMLDLFRDHLVTRKSTYVYNIFPLHEKSWYKSKINFCDNHNVVYMGMLHPVKGFHVLARSWKKIVNRVPDAQLYVIGSGKLYDKDAKLGKYGVASESFERLIFPYLEDEDGNLLASVHFMGLMGVEKYDILGKCKVGVPNPTGNSECLPITALEMQLMGCNITTIYHSAYIDTVMNQAYLYHSTSQLANYVIRRLKAKRDNYDDLYEFISKKFNADKSIARWEHILTTINEPMVLEPCSSQRYQMKKFKNFLFKAKLMIPWLNRLPLVERFYNFYHNRLLKSNQ